MAIVRSQSVPFELKNSRLVDVFKNKLKHFFLTEHCGYKYLLMFVCYFVFQVNFYCPFFILDV